MTFSSRLSYITVQSLEFPSHKYFEFIEQETGCPKDFDEAMYERLWCLYEAFLFLRDASIKTALFLIKFQITTPRSQMIPKDIHEAYLDFIASYKKLDYKRGDHLTNTVDIVMDKLIRVIKEYEKYLNKT